MTRVVLKIQYSHKTIKKPRTKEKRKNENLIKSNLKTKTSPLKKTSSIGQNDTSPPKNSPPKTSPSKTTNSPKITSPQTDPISSNEFHDVVKSSNMAGDNNKMTPKEKKRPKKVNLFDTGNDREGTKTSIPTTEQRNRSWSSSGPEVKVSSLKDIMSHQSDQHDLNSNSSPREKKNFKPNRRRQARGQDIIRWEQENTIEISKRSPLSPWGQARPVNIRTSPDHGPLNSPLSKSSSPIKSPIKVDEFVPQTPPKSQTVSHNNGKMGRSPGWGSNTTTSLNEIMAAEARIEKIKNQRKSLAVIEAEEKAIIELTRFYKSEFPTDHSIRVVRVTT